MSSSLGLTPEIVRYLAHVNPPEHPALTRCREETARMPNARMQISAEQGAFCKPVRMLNAKRVRGRRLHWLFVDPVASR
jgi:caffeoyl-CoA O-methyltransferase